MVAAEARKLRIGDWVKARFGGRGYVKTCQITAIKWPRFTLSMNDYRGNLMVRTRNYRSIISASDGPGLTGFTWPSWLEKPRQGETDC